MKALIKLANKRDKQDPFQKILWNKNHDFLENENFFMSICVIQIMNTSLGLLVLHLFHSEINYKEFSIWNFNSFYNYINTPFEIVGLLTWGIIVWRGTKKELFFSKKVGIIFGVVGFCILISNVYSIYASYREEDDATNESFIIMVINSANQLYVYVRYFSTYILINCFDYEVEEFVVNQIQS